jgi:hypothetical protein
LSIDAKKNKNQAKVMLGNTIRAPKRMLNDTVKDTIYIKISKSKPLPIHKNNNRFKKAFTKLPL